MRTRRPKRYVLIQADGKLSPGQLETLTKMLEQRHGKLGLTLLDSAQTSLIVKTDNAVAIDIRKSLNGAKFGDRAVGTVLASGSIGKLKRRVRGTSAREDGKVP